MKTHENQGKTNSANENVQELQLCSPHRGKLEKNELLDMLERR